MAPLAGGLLLALIIRGLLIAGVFSSQEREPDAAQIIKVDGRG